ncbi:MAG: hypothetical protein ACJKSS_01160 [Patescibacteria group bacterium UBA2103]
MTNKIAAGVLSVGMLFALVAPMSAHAALTEAQIQSILSLLNSFGADAATISNVDASLRGNAPTGGNTGSGSSASVCPYTWTRSLTVGDSGADVMALQKFLNSDSATMIAASGVGSAGSESDYFGSLTAAAVAKFQNKYASEVLAPVGLSAGTGFFGSSTRAKANALCVSGNNNGGNNGGGTAPVTGAGLSVALAADSPNNVALVQGQGIGELAKFTFTNNNSASMNVNSLTFNRIGVSTDSTLGDVFLFMGGERLTDAAAVSNSQFSFQNSAGIFTVPAGSSVTISVRANIAASTAGQQVGTSLVSVGASGALNSGVSFPIVGGVHGIAAGTLATMTFQTYNGPDGDANFTPADNTEVWENSVVIGTRDVYLHSLTIKNEGSADPSDFANLMLYVDGVQYGSTLASLNASDKAVFDLSSSPLKLKTGTRTFRVLADVIGGSGETFDFEVDKTADVLAIDSELTQAVTPTLTATSGSANTIDSAALSIAKAATSRTDNVAVDATNVKWATFEFRASGENVKIEAITVDADTSVAGGLDNGKVFLNGAQVGSTRDIAEAGTEFTFGSSMILSKGETAIVEIYADAKTTTAATIAAAETVDVGVSVTASDTEGMNSGNAIAASISEVEGNSITIASSSVSASKFSGYSDQTMIAGTNNARLGSFTLSGASTEDTNISQITVTLSSAEAATITNLMLKDRSTGAQLGVTKTTPGTSNSYSVNFTLPESGTKTIDLIGNIKTGSNAGSWNAVVSGTGSGVETGSTVTISSTTLQTITIGSGSLSASVGAGDPNADNVVAGQSAVHVGQFNFAAANSPYTVRELQVKIPNGASTSISNVTLKYTNSNGAVEEKSQALVTGAGAGTASFTGLDFYIPADDDRNVDVYVSIPTIASGAVAGAAISADLAYNAGFKATDAAGTTSTSIGSADISANGTFYVRKSVPTFGAASKPTSVPAAGQALYEFTISADSAGAVEWKQLTFTVATQSTTLTGFYLRQKGQSTNINDANVDANGSGNVVIYAGTSTNSDVEQIAAGASKTYQLYATTLSGWASGDSININITEDTFVAAVAGANGLLSENNFVWSDRSATSHTTATADWTNSYLLDDLTGGDAVSYSQS